MKGKVRLSVSVDAENAGAGQAAVQEGRAENLSAWVNDALRLKADHDRRLGALRDFISAYEEEHGRISEQEIDVAVRRTRERATPIRGQRSVADHVA